MLCQTAQFGSALHTALMRCSEYDVDGSISSHFLRQDLRKRDAPDAQYISGLGQPSAVYSVHRRGSVSASAYARPTMAERADYGPYGGMDQATTTAAPSSLISQYEYGTSEPVLNPAVRH
ncbi:MAG: hypothetical protein M1819_002323 [Sarea resinae]|nr:MAG: hypothetical protein M1819_002323 [Sarea resinae]